MNGLADEARAVLLGNPSFAPGGVWLVAVSGGLDSTVLLHLLAALAAREDWRLVAAHYNHGLRGGEANDDEAFVRAEAARLGLECVVERGEVRERARLEGISVEMCARLLRHEFLARSVLARGGRDVLLAHHADDQVETLLLRLVRGSGEGLGGMAPVAPSPVAPQVRLWRPLLRVEKASLAAYAMAHGLSYREDSTNRSAEALRNRIRLEMVPWLRRHLQPRLTQVVGRSMAVLRDQADCLDGLAAAWLAHAGPAYAELHVAVQRAVLLRQLHALGIEVSFELVEELRQHADRTISAPGSRNLRRSADGRIEVLLPRQPVGLAPLQVEFDSQPGQTVYAGLSMAWGFRSVRPGDEVSRQFVPGREWLDADAVGGRAWLRTWQPGDRYRPLGLGHRVKLQDAFTNQKTPPAERHRRVILCREDGTILWVEGLRLGEAGRLTGQSRRLLEWTWHREAGEPSLLHGG